MHTPQFFTWTTHTAETTTLLEATRLQKLYTYMCNIVTEFYLYNIVYIYLINSRLDVTHSAHHHFRTIQTLSGSTLISDILMQIVISPFSLEILRKFPSFVFFTTKSL